MWTASTVTVPAAASVNMPAPASAPTAAEQHSMAAVLKPLTVKPVAQNHSGAQKADPGHNLRRDPRRIRCRT